MYEETTIAAIATSPGEGGIGIIRISGIDACCIADKIFQARGGKFAESTPYLMRFGHVVRGDKTIVDEGLAVFMKAPHSYTGEDVVEIQIHGSMEALRQTLALVLENGAVPAARGEFTKRAFLNGRLDLTQAEAVMDVIEAKGAAALSQAESHLSGKLSSFVHTCRDELTDLITKLEVTIDYPEEDLEDLTNEQMEEGLVTIQKSLADLLQRSEEGRIIKDGLRTAIVGRPNAGKSSLLNALLQEDRAIVTDIPGTTRDTIEESIKIGGVPLVLMDTAGLRETDNRVEQIGIERARASMEKADLILAVIDGSQPLPYWAERRMQGMFPESSLTSSISVSCGRSYLLRMTMAFLPLSEERRFLSSGVSGMDDLKEELRKITGHQDADAGRELFLTNLRHVDLVKKSLASVERALESVRNGMPADCIVVDLTEAWTQMGAITGDTVDDELINGIFERFCVGK